MLLDIDNVDKCLLLALKSALISTTRCVQNETFDARDSLLRHRFPSSPE